MIRGILQFTLRIAFRCVLHRCESQEIRCLKLYYFQLRNSQKVHVVGYNMCRQKLIRRRREEVDRVASANEHPNVFKVHRCKYMQSSLYQGINESLQQVINLGADEIRDNKTTGFTHEVTTIISTRKRLSSSLSHLSYTPAAEGSSLLSSHYNKRSEIHLSSFQKS